MATTILNKISDPDSSEKYVWKCDDKVTETSALTLEYRDPAKVICVPTQFGCPVRCNFCASKDLPYSRNIDSDTLTELIEKTLDFSEISGNFQVSFMGQGEPLFNLDNLSKVYTHLKKKYPPIKFGMSTIGIPHLLQRLLDDYTDIVQETKFQISLHSTLEQTRRRLIPYSRSYSLLDLFEKTALLAERSGRKICLNYLLFDGVNDSQEELNNLKEVNPNLFYIKLSRYNQMDDNKLRPSQENKFGHFAKELRQAGIEVNYFQSRGVGVNAGCGQLCRQYYKCKR